MNSYVEYNSNNSGGSWWLTDENWKALEAAGWKVQWYTLGCKYENGQYVRDPDGTPTLVPVSESDNKFNLGGKNGRWLGALAKRAFKPGAISIREAADEWEKITGACATDAGCACCGPPHEFTLYRDGKYIESGPTTRYTATWE